MLGTATKGSIYYEHVLEKAKKEIAKVNKLSGRVTKALEKYKGVDISEDKTLSELQSVVRTYCQLMGKPLELPNDIEELLEVAKKYDEEFTEKQKKYDQVDATVFLRDPQGHARISTHMILGNLKENMRIVVNHASKEDKKTFPIQYKVGVGEAFALDVKPVTPYMKPSHDIVRGESESDADNLPFFGKGKFIFDRETKRILLERPVSFERMGKKETAILISEMLPPGTEFSTILRVRNGSPIDYKVLDYMFSLGKSNGLGAWRGSGNMGSFIYKLKQLTDYEETFDGGWK